MIRQKADEPVEMRRTTGMAGAQIDLAQNSKALAAASFNTTSLESIAIAGHHLPYAGARAVTKAQTDAGVHRARLAQAGHILHRGDRSDGA